MIKKRGITMKQEQDSRSGSNPQNDSSQPVYEVQKIVKKKFHNGKPLYMIKWKGYPQEQNTWEPIEHLTLVQQMVKQFDIISQNTNIKPKKTTVDKQLNNKKRKKQTKPSVLKHPSQGTRNSESQQKIQKHSAYSQLNYQTSNFKTFKCLNQVDFGRQTEVVFSQVDEEKLEQLKKMNQSFSFNNESVLSFLAFNNEQIQKTQYIQSMKTLSYSYKKPQQRNLKALISCLRQSNNKEENLSSYDPVLSQIIRLSKSAISEKGAIISQIPRIMCEVKVYNSLTKQTKTGCLIPLEQGIKIFPRLVDLKLQQILRISEKKQFQQK